MATPDRNSGEFFLIAFFSFFLVALSLWIQGDIGLSFTDEGYLWYGAIQTKSGQVPIRDFQSYDPGRYYWSAAWYYLLGSGIMALRISSGIFQGIGLTLALLAARRAVSSYWKLALVGLLLIVWMYPIFKLVDVSLAMAAVFFAVRLVEKPSFSRHFVAGAFVGLAAFFGRNHGVYGFLALGSLIFLIWLKWDRDSLTKRLAAWGAGILCGFSPMILMFLFVPGFFNSFMEPNVFLLKAGATNLALPMPWSYKIFSAGVRLDEQLFSLSMVFLFLAMPVFYLFGVISLFFTGKEKIGDRALFAASVLVGIFYMHYAFSRADMAHLTISMPPFLIGLVSLPVSFRWARKKALAVTFTCVISMLTFFSVLMISPYFSRDVGDYVQYDIRGDSIWLDKRVAAFIDIVKHINAGISTDDKALLMAPHWPALYCILGRRSPVSQTYSIFPEPVDSQKRMIKTLEENNVRWAILSDVPMDGRDELRFRNTHALMWQYLKENFKAVENTGLPEGTLFLQKKILYDRG